MVRQSRDVNGQNQEVWESWLSAHGCSERTLSDLAYALDVADGLLIPFLSQTGVDFSTTKEAKDPLEGFTIGHNKARSETRLGVNARGAHSAGTGIESNNPLTHLAEGSCL